MQPLPIDSLTPEIVGTLRRQPALVIEAPPGAGKTTRVPPALLSLGLGEVLVLEPRRLAARMAARRVAMELGERLGATVGYQVRLESSGGRDTRLWYLTEGVLTRRIVSGGALSRIGVVVLDEFHERHLEGDFALALVGHLRATARPDLRVVVMSATLDAGPIAGHLGSCPVLRSEGQLHPVAVRYTPHSAEPLEEQVRRALEQLVREGMDGHALVFLPGAAEIRRTMGVCRSLAERAGFTLLPLHGDLPAEEQDRAVMPSSVRKVILSTNVAESSITIEGVTAVIDSGLARVASDSPWTGLTMLKVSRVSKAAANQRAGRAGRTGPGRVIRLYPEEDFVRRADHETPDIVRRELSGTCLEARAFGVTDLRGLPWLDTPPEESLAAAEALLTKLGAVDGVNGLTEVGRRMARLPLHPRLARLALAAEERGAGEEGCTLAAMLSAGDRLPDDAAKHVGPSDLLLLAEMEVHARTRRLAEQIRRALNPGRQVRHDEEALLQAVLTAFPDRVARRRHGNELLLASGGAAVMSSRSVVRQSDFLVAVDIEERREQGLPLVRLASAIRAEWLLDLFPERVSERRRVEWNREAERVDASAALLFDELVLEESRSGDPDSVEARRLLVEKAVEAGISRFVDAETVHSFLARVSFAALHSAIVPLGPEHVRAALEELSNGLRSFRELEEAARSGLLRALRSHLSHNQARLLDEVAPEWVVLKGGRRTRVHYSPDKPPWAASRLQDFFGMRDAPRVAGGKVPVVLHLLAPNQRPVQMTTDLAGFWARLYPQVRRELARRYPKHAWPENPL